MTDRKTKTSRRQRTLEKEVSYSGIGLHTGTEVIMRFCPAPINTGIIFKRTDLDTTPIIPATVKHVHNTARSTNIGGGTVIIHTVEHVLAALKAYDIDNLIIQVSGIEIPVGNGSSDVFVDLIEESGIVEQEDHIDIVSIKEPLFWADDEIQLVALPSSVYRISYTLHYPESPAIGSQFFSTPITAEGFKEQIAPCRTFAKYEEVSLLMDRGLIKGGSLDNAVIVKDDVILSKEGLKFPDEMVRHKILDLIGDLSLVGVPFCAHIIAIRSGHTSNVAFADVLYNHIMKEKHQ